MAQFQKKYMNNVVCVFPKAVANAWFPICHCAKINILHVSHCLYDSNRGSFFASNANYSILSLSTFTAVYVF